MERDFLDGKDTCIRGSGSNDVYYYRDEFDNVQETVEHHTVVLRKNNNSKNRLTCVALFELVPNINPLIKILNSFSDMKCRMDSILIAGV